MIVRQERLAAEGEALGRDRVRLAGERAVVVADLDAHRRAMAAPMPLSDIDLEAALADAERSLAEAAAELAVLRAADRARGEELAAVQRAEAARATELETARRRVAEAERRAAAESGLESVAAARVPALEAALRSAREALSGANDQERLAVAAREAARTAAEAADAARSAALDRAGARSGALAARRGRLEALSARLGEEESRGIARAAKRRGGRRLDEELVVEPAFRAAVQAALSEVARAYLVARAAVGELGDERGILMVGEAAASSVRLSARAAESMERRVRDLVAAKGGGLLDQAVRRDPVGGATRVLARAAWLPTLADCLEIQPDLPPGWIAVPRDGSAVVTDLTVTFGAADTTLERRAEVDTLTAEVVRLDAEASAARTEADEASRAATATRQAVDQARAAESSAAAMRRRSEEAERLAARDLEVVVRELGWHQAQAARLAGEVDAHRAGLVALEAAAAAADAAAPDASGPEDSGHATESAGPASAVAAWEQRAADLRARRDRLAGQATAGDLARRDAEARRARAEATVVVRGERLVAIDRELERLADRERELSEVREQLGRDGAEVAVREAAARQALDQLLAADGVDRDHLAAAERTVAAIRERLRATEEQARAAERASLEADLGLEALREQLLVDLAGLGEVALRHLPARDAPAQSSGNVPQPSLIGGGLPVPGAEAPLQLTSEGAAEDDRLRLERGLLAAARRWTSDPAPADATSATRLGQLRRRFHDLGAANPFAVEEYQALRTRLEDLETQRADLGRAIERTRQLIEELTSLITEQFQTTFRALEAAFDERFQQLFGGGFAKLELTDPADLGSTGVEITARPPGKKKQPLGMLSGGERSLTAVALLLAMLQVRPVPFCVLDEVDAALDEANVGRFTAALRDLAQSTQLIVITHNRGTIRAADALYGVTVGDDSVSRVISLRLDEANAIVASRRGHASAVPQADAGPLPDAAAG